MVLVLPAALLCSCTKPAKQMSGDLGSFVLECTTSRGGGAASNRVPTLPAEWAHYHSRMQDLISVKGDCFDEIEAFLRDAFGPPDRDRGSIPVVRTPWGGQGLYSTQQIGVELHFAGGSNSTVIIVWESRKP